MLRARGGQPAAEGVLGVAGQPPPHGRLGRPGHTGLRQHAQAIDLRRGLDDPREHQGSEHLIGTGRPVEPQVVIGHRQRAHRCPAREATIGYDPTRDRARIGTQIQVRAC